MVNEFTAVGGSGGSGGSDTSDEEERRQQEEVTTSKTIDAEAARASSGGLESKSGETLDDVAADTAPSTSSSQSSGTSRDVDTGGLTRQGQPVDEGTDSTEIDTGGLTQKGGLNPGGSDTQSAAPQGGASRGSRRSSSTFDGSQEVEDTQQGEQIEQGRTQSAVSEFERRTGVDIPGEGPIATTRTEFGEVDFSFGFGGEGDEVEQAAANLESGTQETFTPIAEGLFGKPDKVIGGSEYSSAVAIGLNAAGKEQAAGVADQTIRNVGKGIVVGTPTAVAGLPKAGLNIAEVGVELVDEPVETAGKIPGAAAAAAVSGTEGFLRNPGTTTGAIIGGAAIGRGVGKVAAGTRLGKGRTGKVINTIDIDPGKMAVKGARGARRFARDDRGQVNMGKTRSRGGGETDVDAGQIKIDGENVDIGGFDEVSDRGVDRFSQPRLNTPRARPSGRPSSRYNQDPFPNRGTPPVDDMRRLADVEDSFRDVDAGGAAGASGASGAAGAAGAGAGVVGSISAGDLTGVTVPATFDEGRLTQRGEVFGKTDVEADAVGAGDMGGTLVDTGALTDVKADAVGVGDMGGTIFDTDAWTDTTLTPDDSDTTQTPDDTGTTYTPDDSDTIFTPEETITPDPEGSITPDPDPDPDPDPEFIDPDPDPDPEPDWELLPKSKSERRGRTSFDLFSNEIENSVTDPGDVIAGEVDLFEDP